MRKDQMEGIELIFPREMKTASGFISSIQAIVKTISKRCIATLKIGFLLYLDSRPAGISARHPIISSLINGQTKDTTPPSASTKTPARWRGRSAGTGTWSVALSGARQDSNRQYIEGFHPYEPYMIAAFRNHP